MSIIQRVVDEKCPHWECPDCGTFYFGTSIMRFCPKCREESERRKDEYWAGVVEQNKSLVSGILAKYLNGGTQSGNGSSTVDNGTDTDGRSV